MMATTTPGGFGIDTRQLRVFGAACRRAAVMTREGFATDLLASGELIANEARHEAGKHSKSIPPTIRMLRRVARVDVQAGSNEVPLASLYERGNKGSSPDSPTFSHPLFGDKSHQYSQPRYPFMRPAVEKTYPEVGALLGRTADAVVDEIAHGT